MREESCKIESHTPGPQPSILFPYAPAEFWERIRIIIREEIGKSQPLAVLPHSPEVAGMTYKPLYKMDEVCALFSVSRQTIYDWVSHGLLKPQKVRSRVYFLWDDLKILLHGES